MMRTFSGKIKKGIEKELLGGDSSSEEEANESKREATMVMEMESKGEPRLQCVRQYIGEDTWNALETGKATALVLGVNEWEDRDLFCLEVNDTVVQAIARRWKHLQELDLGYCMVTDAGVSHLRKLKELRKLNLAGCISITDAGVSHLRKLKELRELDLSYCNKITDGGVLHLRKLKKLQELDLFDCDHITDAGVLVLRELEELEDLCLSGCHRITDASLSHLRELKELRELDLSYCDNITDAGLSHLRKLKKLQLYVDGCEKITAAMSDLQDTATVRDQFEREQRHLQQQSQVAPDGFRDSRDAEQKQRESQHQQLVDDMIRCTITELDALRSAELNDEFGTSLQQLKWVCGEQRHRRSGTAHRDTELRAVVTSIYECTDELRQRILARLDHQHDHPDTDADDSAESGADTDADDAAMAKREAEICALCTRREELVNAVLSLIDRDIAEHKSVIERLQTALDRLDEPLNTVTAAVRPPVSSDAESSEDDDEDDNIELAFVGLADGHPSLLSFRRLCSSYLDKLDRAAIFKQQLTRSLKHALAPGATMKEKHQPDDPGATWAACAELEQAAAAEGRRVMPVAFEVQELCALQIRRLNRARKAAAQEAIEEGLHMRSLLESELRDAQRTIENMTADRLHWAALRDACQQKAECVKRLQDMQRRILDLDETIMQCKVSIAMAQRRQDRKKIRAETEQLMKLQSKVKELHSSQEMRWCRSTGTRLSRLLPELTEGIEFLSPLYGTGAERLPLLDKTTDYTDVELLTDSTGAAVVNDTSRHRVFRARLIASCHPNSDAHASESKGDTEGRLCVLKEFALSDSSESRRALRKSLHVMLRINHPNVMTVEGIATETSLDSAVSEQGHVTHWYIQMPYMPKSLRQWMSDHKPPAAADSPKAWADWAAVCAPILRGIVSGLNALHAEGIVHRDIKPENVLMSEEDVPVLIDFETAFVEDTSANANTSANAAASAASSGLNAPRGLMTATTGVGLVRGTLGYMDPDLMQQLQTTGQATATPAADMFALGVMACEMLTGKRPKGPADVEAVFPAPLKELYPTLLPLLKLLVNHRASDRPSQARVLLSDPFLQSVPVTGTCCICFCVTPLAEGIFCSSTTAPPHFSCDECFDGHVQSKCSENAGQQRRRKGQVPCFGDAKCASAPFDDITVALHVTADTFKQHMAAHQSVVEACVRTELMRKNEERLKEELERLARMDEAQRRVYAARRHIVEEILTSKCPRCKKVFIDFNGCFALTCQDDPSDVEAKTGQQIVGGTGGCGCGFCAWCLEDCGGDAHRHVVNCRYNAAPGREVYGSQALFEQAQRTRRRRLLDDYLGTLDAATRGTVLEECKQDLKDLGLADMR